MPEELKPCPFCRSNKLKVECKSVFAGTNGLDERVERHTYSVRCSVCHARGSAFGGRVLISYYFRKDLKPPIWATTDDELQNKAITAWNTRT